MIQHSVIRLWAATNQRLERSQRGAGLVEYSMLIGLIVLVCIAAVTVLGGTTETPYSELGSSLAQ